MPRERAAGEVELRFHAELNDHLPPDRRHRGYRRRLFLSPTVKDLVEAEGVPHCEIDLILVNGVSVGFGHRVEAGDRIAVHPAGTVPDGVAAPHRLSPPPLPEARFIVDVNMGKLAKRLRMLGFDTLYRDDYGDAEIVRIARDEGRMILTRDRALLKRGEVLHGYWVRANHPAAQIDEVLARFDLAARLDPFSRCSVCNGVVGELPREQARGRVPAAVHARFTTFWGCAGCGRVYWEGSHFDGLQAWMARRLP